ncbi:MAG TPA: insulinase family protein [Pyrinomonadaceae bacterium]|nr:insulinase family protein [Pyrinomonadaceae bacterium]
MLQTTTKLILSAAIILSGALSLAAYAQTNPQQQGMKQTEDFRKQAPPPLAARPLNIPKPFETTLPNGLQVVIVEDPRLPLVSYRLALRAGDINDPADTPGLLDMVTGLLSEGTAKRTSKQIADEVARYGATLTAGANADYSTVAASALSTYGNEVLDLLADVVLNPTFPESEVKLAQQNALQGLQQQRSQPGFLANERMAQVLFGQHPYSIVSATPESINAMSHDRLLAFHRSMFVPNNSVLLIVGDVRRDEVLRRVNDLFGKWAKGQTDTRQFPQPPTRNSRALYIVDRPGSAQSNIVIANPAINRTNKDYFPMLLMNVVLGANASSRLFMNLREQKGYTYGAYSELDARRLAGSFRETAEVRTPVTGESLKEFFYELGRIRDEVVSDKEIRDAKSFLTGVFPLQIETQEGLINRLVQIKMYDLPADYLQTYRDRINAVTVADIQRVARQYIHPDKAAIVIVGDASAIMEQVKPYAQTMEVYDISGKRKELTAPNTVGTTVSANTSAPATPATAANLIGKWDIQITAPNGASMPATLTVNQENGRLTGKVSGQFGEADLTDVTVNGNSFDSNLNLNLGGQTVNGKVSGKTASDQMEGTININIPNVAPLPFKGSRSK